MKYSDNDNRPKRRGRPRKHSPDRKPTSIMISNNEKTCITADFPTLQDFVEYALKEYFEKSEPTLGRDLWNDLKGIKRK